MRVSSTNLLYPPFLIEMNVGLDRARKAGFEMYPFETYRSYARQNELYMQGRATPGKIVTNAKPRDSWHHYGLAMDVARKVDGKWNWEFDPFEISKFFAGLQVTWGGSKDGPHYQWKHLLPIEKSKSIVEEAGVLGLWSILEAR